MVERSSLLRFTPVAHDRPLPHRLVRLLPCPASRSSPRHRASIISSSFPSPYNAQGSVHSFCFSHDMGTGLARAWRVDRRSCEGVLVKFFDRSARLPRPVCLAAGSSFSPREQERIILSQERNHASSNTRCQSVAPPSVVSSPSDCWPVAYDLARISPTTSMRR